jgi:hypothetical protein
MVLESLLLGALKYGASHAAAGLVHRVVYSMAANGANAALSAPTVTQGLTTTATTAKVTHDVLKAQKEGSEKRKAQPKTESKRKAK